MNKQTIINKEQTAKIISEVLPYIKQFRKKIIVIKFGGHAMINHTLKKEFASDIALLSMVGFKLVIVHGGGPQIGESIKRSGIVSEFVNGLRKTSIEVMRVVESVLMQINGDLALLLKENLDENLVLAMSGKNEQIFLCDKKSKDLGFVGNVQKVNIQIVQQALDANQIPLICPIGYDYQNNSYNINADIAANEIAKALLAEKLIFLTDTIGVLDEDQKLITNLQSDATKKLIDKAVIQGGMIPKVGCALDALKNGVKRVHIIDGRVSHSLLIELLTNKGIGTVIKETKINSIKH